jgi:hypothetical protein
MTGELESVRPDRPLYRIGRRPDPWAWPSWAYAGEDGTFGNRYDDPLSEYRVLYASSERLGPFLETLARFRRDPAIAASEIAGDPRDADFPTMSAGVVPARWLEERTLGVGRCDASFADIGQTRSLAHLRVALAPMALHYRLDDLDASTIRAGAPRAFTQAISRYVYTCTTADGERAYQGIRYLSRLGDDIQNWAICEPAAIEAPSAEPLRPGDPDLLRAFELFELAMA